MDLETLAIRYETLGEDEVRQSMDRITDSTREMTLTQMKAIEINDAMSDSNTRAAAATGAHGFQIGRLRQDLGSLIGRLTGTNLAVDRVASALGAMAIGNVAIIGVLAGIAALTFGFEKLIASLKGVTAEQEKAAAAFEKAQRLKEAGGNIGVQASALQAEVTQAQTDLDRLNARLAYAQANPTAPGVELTAPLEESIRKQKAVLAQKTSDLQKANDEVFKERQKAAFTQLQQEAGQLAELVRSKDSTKKVRDQALALEREYFADAKALEQAGNIEAAAEYTKLAETLQSAFTKADKQPKVKATSVKDLAGLSDFLAEQKAEVAAMEETHALQVKLEQDSTDSTAEKYAKIEALDQAYLIQIMSVYGAESKEYDAVLKEMEEHRKQHTDAIVAEGRRQTQLENAEADRQSTEDEQELKRRERVAENFAKSTADVIAETFKKGLAKGGNASSALQGFGDGLLKQLGGIFVRMGEKSVAASAPLAIIRAGLSNIFTAPEASLAGGLALIALGEALDAIGSGGGGGGSGGGPVQSTLAPVSFGGSVSVGGTNAASTAGQITPITPVNATIIGPNDPQAQRQLVTLLANAARRNL